MVGAVGCLILFLEMGGEYMGRSEHRCMECDEAISNPICSECLASRMRMVIGEENRRLARAIKGIVTSGATVCLFCGKEVGVCAHCFSQDVLEYLEEKNMPLAALFKSQFDFDLRQRSIDFD